MIVANFTPDNFIPRQRRYSARVLKTVHHHFRNSHSLVVASLVFIYFFTKQRFILFLILFQYVWIKSTLQGRRLLLFLVLLPEMCDNLFDTFPHLNALDFCILRIICKWVIHKLSRRVSGLLLADLDLFEFCGQLIHLNTYISQQKKLPPITKTKILRAF